MGVSRYYEYRFSYGSYSSKCILTAHFKDTGRQPSYYDVIATGDLGYIGKAACNRTYGKRRLREMGEKFYRLRH